MDASGVGVGQVGLAAVIVAEPGAQPRHVGPARRLGDEQIARHLGRRRARVGEGLPLWYLVPDGVVQYVAKRGLYTSANTGAVLQADPVVEVS